MMGLSSATSTDSPNGANEPFPAVGITERSPRTAARMPAEMCSTLAMTLMVRSDACLSVALACTWWPAQPWTSIWLS
ncbi:hypothetical protein D3C72_1797580 [compost metagenome]